MAKIYLASSWRCKDQPRVVDVLRDAGHEIYDFRNPAPGKAGFAWGDVDSAWLHWTPRSFISHLTTSPVAADGFKYDKDALDWCDTLVLLLPSGRSAHLEAGYACGQDKKVVVYLHPDQFEPELMYLLASDIVDCDDAMLKALT